MPDAAKNPPKRIICYVTDGRSLGATGADRSHRALEKVWAAIDAGVDWVQIREKDVPSRILLALAGEAVAAASAASAGNARVIVNDRLDIALAAGAAGVHLGGESVPAADVVHWCRGGNAPADFLVGVSCHDLEHAREAETAGASYVFFGPVFDTPAKRAFGSPQGIPLLEKVCASVRIPVIAIGGISGTNAFECFRAGARGIAAIRLFQETEAAELKRRIEKLRGSG